MCRGIPNGAHHEMYHGTASRAFCRRVFLTIHHGTTRVWKRLLNYGIIVQYTVKNKYSKRLSQNRQPHKVPRTKETVAPRATPNFVLWRHSKLFLNVKYHARSPEHEWTMPSLLIGPIAFDSVGPSGRPVFGEQQENTVLRTKGGLDLVQPSIG